MWKMNEPMINKFKEDINTYLKIIFCLLKRNGLLKIGEFE